MPRVRAARFRFVMRAVGGYNVFRDLVATATVLIAILAPGGVVTAVALVVAAAMTYGRAVWLTAGDVRAGLPPRLVMGTATLARIAVVAAALAVEVEDDAGVVAGIAAVLIALMIIGEQSIRRPVSSAAPQIANIEGWDVPVPSRVTANRLFVLSSLAGVALVVSAIVQVTQVPALVLALAATVPAAIIGLQSVQYLSRRNRLEANLPKILAEMGPVFAFHWQAPAGTAYQATMWLPYLERLGVPYFILVRTAANFAEIAPLTDAPVIRRQGLEDLDPIVTPSLKAVFYANTAVRNSHMIRFPHLTHIQLNHGDSDKIASVSPTFRQYDKNFVAGQAAVDRFALHGVQTRADQFEIVGRPQLEHVVAAERSITDVEQPTVLYSPTWSGFYDDSDYSSLRAGTVIVEALLQRGCTVLFRPHPYSRRHQGNTAACDAIYELLAQDRLVSGRAHLFGAVAESEMSVVECFNASDAMVSDVSSLVSDYLMSGKPIAMAAVSAHGDAFVEAFPLARSAYVFDVTKGAAPGLPELLEQMIGADPMADVRRSMREYYLGDAPAERVVEQFVERARAFL
jgi:hypothetical protein